MADYRGAAPLLAQVQFSLPVPRRPVYSPRGIPGDFASLMEASMFLRCCAGACIAAGVALAFTREPAADDHVAHMAAGDLAAPIAVPNGTQGLAGLPPSNNTATARLNASPRHGEWVKLAWEPGSKDSLMAWIVYPSTSNAKTPVVVVVQEIF